MNLPDKLGMGSLVVGPTALVAYRVADLGLWVLFVAVLVVVAANLLVSVGSTVTGGAWRRRSVTRKERSPRRRGRVTSGIGGSSG